MRVYTAHLKPAKSPVLLREGWTWLGFLFGPLWLLANGAWILEGAAIVSLIALAPAPFVRPALLGLAVLVGLLGRDLVRWSLHRRGYALAHVLLAPNADAALFRLFTSRADLAEQQR